MFRGTTQPTAQGSASGTFNQHPQTPTHYQPQEPPLVAVTSDLPEYGGSPSPRPDDQAAPHHPIPHSALSTSNRSRLEVVLNASPGKLPGHRLWQEAHLADPNYGEDELASPVDHPSPAKKRKAGRPVGSKSHQSTPVPAADPSAPKRRGRPKGWRPGMPSTKTGKPTASAARYLDEHGNRIPHAPSSAVKGGGGPPKRRGRPPRAPPRAPPPTARKVWEAMEAPTYVTFLCEWTRCKAELQNAETLRRHVRKLHGLKERDGGGWVCRWAKCGRVVEGEERVFATVEELHAHLEARHFVPLVWQVGDGACNAQCVPRSAAQVEEKIPAYLLGPDGKQVTPWVKYQKEEDNATRMRNRNRLRDILMQRDANAPLQEEDEGSQDEGAESSVLP